MKLIVKMFILIVFSLTGYASGNPFELSKSQIVRLYDAVKQTDTEFISVDITLYRKIIFSPEETQKHMDGISNTLQKVKQIRGDSGVLTVELLGYYSPINQYEIMSEERIRFNGLETLQNDISYYASGERKKVKMKISKIKNDEGLYNVDDVRKRLTIDTKGMNVTPEYDLLSYGKVHFNSKIVSDIYSNYIKKDMVPKTSTPSLNEFSYVGQATVNGSLTDQIVCYNNRLEQAQYYINVDPNDWSKCYAISWINRKTGQLSKSVQYLDFFRPNGCKYLFPRQTIVTNYNDLGKELKCEIVDIKSASFKVSHEPEAFKAKHFKRFKTDGFEILDKRFDSPLKLKPKEFFTK